MSALQGSALHGHQTTGIERYIPTFISQIFWVGNIKGEMCLEYSFLTHPDTQLLGCSYNLREVEYLLAFHALYA